MEIIPPQIQNPKLKMELKLRCAAPFLRAAAHKEKCEQVLVSSCKQVSSADPGSKSLAFTVSLRSLSGRPRVFLDDTVLVRPPRIRPEIPYMKSTCPQVSQRIDEVGQVQSPPGKARSLPLPATSSLPMPLPLPLTFRFIFQGPRHSMYQREGVSKVRVRYPGRKLTRRWAERSGP